MSILSQNRGAQHEKTVLLCVDEGYFPYALFLANQIAIGNPDRDFDICIASATPLPDHALVESLDLRICVLGIDIDQSKLPVNDQIPFASYLRIFALGVLQQDYRRILYLDADIFYARGDISRLLDLDIGGHAVAAARDANQLRLPERRPKDYKPFNLANSKYFNAGVLLIDTARFIEQKIGPRVVEFALEKQEQLMAHDQTALNCVLHGNWAELSIVWNFQYNYHRAFYSGMFDVCFFHFVSRRKPFIKGAYCPSPRRFTEPYRLFFEAHFPELQGDVDDGLEVSKHKGYLWLSFLIHLIHYRKVLENENRWRNDWEVK